MTTPDAPRAIGDYEILATLGAGGMGRVLLARRRGAHGFEKLFAIKTLLPDRQTGSQARKMFLDEARLLSQLSHPSVANVYDFGDEGGLLYLVMELIEGLALNQLKSQHQPVLPIGAACRLLAEVCRGLHAAHDLTDRSGQSLGVVHRDISPQNIMLTFAGRAKIVDFGIALMRERLTEATQIGQIKGKPSYMAPEQLEQSQADRRVDVWATSVVLWELLARQHLFKKGSLGATVTAVLKQPIPAPSQLNADVPPGLDAIVLRGLQRDAAKRYQTALELAYDLDGVASTRPDETPERFAVLLTRERAAQRRRLDQLLTAGQEPVSRAPLAAKTPGRDTDVPPASLGQPRAPAPPAEDRIDTGRVRSAGHRLPWAIGLAMLLLLGSAAAIWHAVDDSGLPPDVRQDAELAPRPPPSVTPLPITPADLAEGPAKDASTADLAVPVQLPPDPIAQPVSRTSPSQAQPARKPRRRQPRPTPPIRTDPTPASVERGTISVYADPYAQVWIDGTYIGDTPMIRRTIEAGEHLLVLIDPAKGEARTRRTIQVEPGRNRRIALPATNR